MPATVLSQVNKAWRPTAGAGPAHESARRDRHCRGRNLSEKCWLGSRHAPTPVRVRGPDRSYVCRILWFIGGPLDETNA